MRVERKPSKPQLFVLRHLVEGARLDTWLGDGRMWTKHEAIPIKLSTVIALRRRYWIRQKSRKIADKGHWMITRRGRDIVANATSSKKP